VKIFLKELAPNKANSFSGCALPHVVLCGLAVVAYDVHCLPVRWIPKERLIAPVWDDMINAIRW
jgi:hypothetical protein